MIYTLLFNATGTVTVEAKDANTAINTRHNYLPEDIDWNEPQFVACFENKE